ncbi:MAG: sugar ABC transporter permease [Protaetiibacter sp.]
MGNKAPGGTASAVRTDAARRRLDRHRSRRRTGSNRLWLLILPAAVFYLFIVIIPGGQGFFFSLTNWDGLSQDWEFVGFSNYTLMLSNPIAVKALTNTIVYAVISTVFENIFGLLLALGLNSRIKSRNILRVAFFMPVVILSIVVAYLWKFLFLPNRGVFVQIIEALGFDASTVNILGSPDTVVVGISAIVVWQMTGYAMIIYLAGLQGVPEDQLEAAAIDGAGPWQRFWHIVRPMLAPALTVNLILSSIRGFMIFDQIWVTTMGGPADTSHSLSTLVYRTAFTFGKLGQGASLAVMLTVFVAVVGVFQYRSQMRMRGNLE